MSTNAQRGSFFTARLAKRVYAGHGSVRDNNSDKETTGNEPVNSDDHPESAGPVSENSVSPGNTRSRIRGNTRNSAKTNESHTIGVSSGKPVRKRREVSAVDLNTPNSSRASSSDAKAVAAPGVKKTTVAPTIKPLDIVVPDEIGRYTIGRRIGSGTCGVVHHSLDNLLIREVAIKLSPVGEAHVSTGKVPGAQRAYQTEIIAAGRLAHPNIVTIYDAGQFEDLNYLVMESVEGKSLKEYGKGKALLPVGEALRVVSECCRALDYSHSQGILHRDIKPANIMLADDGCVKLLDFGIAVGLSDSGALKKQGPTLGTPNYMSPEQILGRELTAQSDFYSLATVLFELLTGRQLFKAKKVKDLFRTVVHQKAPQLDSIRSDMPRGLSEVIARALEKDPQVRFESGAQMAEALEPFVQSFKSVEQRPLPQQRLIKQLKLQTFFTPFSEVEIALLLERVSVRTYSSSENIIPAATEARRLFVITDGAVMMQKNDRFLQVLGAGECLGEAAFINGVGEAYEYCALTSVSALEFSTEALAELPPKVHLHYYRHISDILLGRLSIDGMGLPDVSL